MRPVWTGAIGFGLVNIPVRLYTAVQDSSLDLDMLDSHDHANIKFKRVNENTGKEVPYKNIVKGYLYDDHYVILEPEDFEAADAKKSKLIEILNFVDADEVETIYYEQPYFIEPDKTGEKAYALLRDALKDVGKVGVSTFVMRNKEALAIIKPYGNALLLNRLRFDQEVRTTDDLNLPNAAKARPKEKEMAQQLIEQLSEKFDISSFKDTYTDKLLDIIKKKASGKKVKVPKLKIVQTESDDLMKMLKASLSNSSGSGTAKKRKSA